MFSLPGVRSTRSPPASGSRRGGRGGAAGAVPAGSPMSMASPAAAALSAGSAGSSQQTLDLNYRFLNIGRPSSGGGVPSVSVDNQQSPTTMADTPAMSPFPGVGTAPTASQPQPQPQPQPSPAASIAAQLSAAVSQIAQSHGVSEADVLHLLQSLPSASGPSAAATGAGGATSATPTASAGGADGSTSTGRHSGGAASGGIGRTSSSRRGSSGAGFLMAAGGDVVDGPPPMLSSRPSAPVPPTSQHVTPTFRASAPPPLCAPSLQLAGSGLVQPSPVVSVSATFDAPVGHGVPRAPGAGGPPDGGFDALDLVASGGGMDPCDTELMHTLSSCGGNSPGDTGAQHVSPTHRRPATGSTEPRGSHGGAAAPHSKMFSNGASSGDDSDCSASPSAADLAKRYEEMTQHARARFEQSQSEAVGSLVFSTDAARARTSHSVSPPTTVPSHRRHRSTPSADRAAETALGAGPVPGGAPCTPGRYGRMTSRTSRSGRGAGAGGGSSVSTFLAGPSDAGGARRNPTSGRRRGNTSASNSGSGGARGGPRRTRGAGRQTMRSPSHKFHTDPKGVLVPPLKLEQSRMKKGDDFPSPNRSLSVDLHSPGGASAFSRASDTSPRGQQLASKELAAAAVAAATAAASASNLGGSGGSGFAIHVARPKANGSSRS